MQNMYRWKGKVAIVTGASSGIGLEICKALANEGMKVIGCARRADRLQKLGKEIASTGGIFTAINCDLANEKDIHSLFVQTKETYGGVDVCINNAGFSYSSSLIDGNVTEWKNAMDVNVIAACLCTQLAIKSMRARNFDTGHIININSLSGHRVPQNVPSHFYSATKFALISLTEGYRQELRSLQSHIRITSVSPGVVQTEFAAVRHNEEVAKKFYTSMESLQAEDIAKIVIDVLSSHPRAQIDEVKVRPVEQVG